MKTWLTLALRTVPVAAIAVALSGAPVTSLAQSGGALPSYARPAGETIKGTIRNFDGAYKMYVRDAHGYIDDVTLRQGTIINPTGIRLQPGYPVTVTGHANGSTFVADEIDTPFHVRSYPGYPYPYYAYPYPVYPYPYLGFYVHHGWGWRP